MSTPAPDLDARQALDAGDVGSAERAWLTQQRAAPDDPAVWTLGVTLAGWRGDREAARRREAHGRSALAKGPSGWLARHGLALAAGEAALRAGDLRAALPLLGEALGQTEWRPEHPAAVDALLALATLHALHAAPRKAGAQVERARQRAAQTAPVARALAHEWRARAGWVELLVDVRTGARTRAAAARRAARLARAWQLAGRTPEALQLALDQALLLGDAELERAALAAADARDLAGVRGRGALLRAALAGSDR